ncbi:MAG: phosphodiester glycosidase family protein [Bacteroidales bacterium]|nr:phosphodiester glycosidase family protein [Bacteroidales bacterium]
MFKRFLIYTFVITFSYPVLASQKDSLVFAEANWDTKSYHAGGIKLRQFAFTDSSLFRSNQFVSILEISSSFNFDVVADTVLVFTSDFVAYAGALAGINGSFFTWYAPWNSDNYLRIDGKELAPNQTNTVGLRSFRQSGCVGVSKKGKLFISSTPSEFMEREDNDFWEKNIEARDLLSSGPVLRTRGKDVPILFRAFNNIRHPRSAIGIRKNGKVLMVVVDGRHKEAAGMTMSELQKVMRWLHAWDALNLDGGGSSTLCVRKRISDSVQVVNHPSDNKLFNKGGERKVANAIVVK